MMMMMMMLVFVDDDDDDDDDFAISFDSASSYKDTIERKNIAMVNKVSICRLNFWIFLERILF
jgi:hypothetical protein